MRHQWYLNITLKGDQAPKSVTPDVDGTILGGGYM